MIKPSARFFRQSAAILRRTWPADVAGGPEPTDPATGQTVVCAVHEMQGRDAVADEPDGDSHVSRRRYDVLIPAIHPATGTDQFPSATYPDGPAIRAKDVVVWGGRRLVVMIDADKAGRGGYGHVYTVQCEEIV